MSIQLDQADVSEASLLEAKGLTASSRAQFKNRN
jgi:hypothetical protein